MRTMRIRKSVFGSAYERSLYKALVSRWSDKLRIYPNLPFMNIIQIGESDVRRNERSFLLKTSVDYTLCDQSDQPLLSIEFDGIGEGFSREGRYVPRHVSSKDPNREWKFNLKLRVCQQVVYPLFILSYEEATPIDLDVNLAVVDGIIGKFLAAQHVAPRISELVEDRRDLIDDLPEWEREEYFQDLIIEAEVEAEYDWNPIVQHRTKFATPLHRQKLCIGHRTEWLRDPSLDAVTRAERVGCRVTVNTCQGPISETVWIRNMDPWVPVFALSEDIADLLAHKRATESLLPNLPNEPGPQ